MNINLEEFGLSSNESQIYLFLVKNGTTTTGSIIKETGVSNSRVYESLNSLIAKGFVSYSVQKDGKHFQAVDPSKFLEVEEDRKKKLEKLVPEITKLKSLKEEKTISAIYEGFEGFKAAFLKIITDCPENGTICILGFSEQLYANESLSIFLKNMNLKSAEKKQKLRIILDSSVKSTLGKDREKEKNTEVRYMPEGYVSPAAIDIFEDYIYTFVWEEKPTIFMVKNKKIAESYKKYFEFLWRIAKK